jgi:hypothetical protein
MLRAMAIVMEMMLIQIDGGFQPFPSIFRAFLRDNGS